MKKRNKSKIRRSRRINPIEIFVDVPKGRSGDWRIERYAVSERDALMFNIRNECRYASDRNIKPGTYTRLMCRYTVVMSDTPAEKRDHIEFIKRAKGQILINGLGLGYAIEVCCRKGTVEHITVIEKSPDVIKLSGPHYLKRYPDKLTIIQADAFTWEPPKGMRYDAVWHDIWNNHCSDNLVEMDQLEKKSQGIADWQGSWGRARCEMLSFIESRRYGVWMLN